MDLINKVMLWFCGGIFAAIEAVYQLFYGLATTRFFSEEAVQKVSNNLYVLVSVVILFAFAVKLIEAIVNPDLLTDSKKGVTGVLRRTIIGLVLIVAVPNIFNFVYYFQYQILSTSLVEKIVLGYTDANTGSSRGGAILTSAIVTGFVYPIDAEGHQITESKLCGDESNCDFAQKLQDENEDYTPYLQYLGGQPDYKELSELNIEKEWEDGGRIYDLNTLLLFVVGVYILYQVITLCMDAALRLVNLGILEIIAPIIIISYMAQGPDILTKWAKMCAEKFLSIFIRIAALAFMILGFTLISAPGSIFNNDSATFMFKLLVIIGLLRLVKDLPNIISKIFGVDIKSGGGIKGRLGEMAGIGNLAQNAWTGLGGLAKAGALGLGPGLLGVGKAAVGLGKTAGKGIGKGAKKLDNFLENKSTYYKNAKQFGKDTKSAINNFAKNNRVAVGARKAKAIVDSWGPVKGAKKVGGVVSGGVKKGITAGAHGVASGARYIGKQYKIGRAAWNTHGKDVSKAVKAAREEQFKNEHFATAQDKLDRKKERIHRELANASGVYEMKDGRADIKGRITGLADSDKTFDYIQDVNAKMIGKSSQLSTFSKEKMQDYNEKLSKASYIQHQSDLQNALAGRIEEAIKLTDNMDQKSALSSLLSAFKSGYFTHEHGGADAFTDRLNNILRSGDGKEGAISSVSDTGKLLSEAVKIEAEQLHTADALGIDTETMATSLTEAQDKVTKAKEGIKKIKETLSDSTAFDEAVSMVEKGYKEMTSEIKRNESKAVNDAIGSAVDSGSGTPAGGSGGSSGGGPGSGGTGSGTSGDGSSGTVNANVDFSSVEKQLDAINESVKKSGRDVSSQVRQTGVNINSNIQDVGRKMDTMNNTLNGIGSDVEKARKKLDDIEDINKEEE